MTDTIEEQIAGVMDLSYTQRTKHQCSQLADAAKSMQSLLEDNKRLEAFRSVIQKYAGMIDREIITQINEKLDEVGK